ncbi:acyl carrier protein [Dyadobacter sp.]|uniref:acyl carrier protein n=1 Tax=Dyadobacter sp. TaxID=1914288 RepID=UPI003F713FB1
MDISKNVTEIISKKTDIDATLIMPEMKLKKDLGMDSLDVIKLIVDLEKEYKIMLPEDAVENFHSTLPIRFAPPKMISPSIINMAPSS